MWQQTYTQHVGEDAFFSPEGSSIVTCGKNGISLWDPKSGVRKGNVLNGSSIDFFCISDSLVVFTGEKQIYDTIEVWNYHTSKHLYSFAYNNRGKAVFDKSGKYLAISMLGKIEIREARSGTLIQTMYHDDKISNDFLSFSHDASFLIVSTCPPSDGIRAVGFVGLWKVKEGTLVQEIDILSDTSDFPLVFSDKENILAYYNKNRSSTIFREILTHNQTGEIPTVGTIVAVGLPEKNNCITNEFNGSIVLWDVHNGKSILEYKGLTGKSICTGFNADTSLLIASNGSNICIWDFKTAELIKKITPPIEGRITNCSINNGTDILVMQDSKSYVLDWAKGEITNIFLPIQFVEVAIVCNENTEEIVMPTERVVERRKLATGELINTAITDLGKASEIFIGINKSGRYAYKISRKADSIYYSFVDMKSGVKKWSVVIKTTTKVFTDICMSNDNSKIAVVKDYSTIIIYDTLGRTLQTINNIFEASGVFFDAEGNLFAFGIHQVTKWNVNTGELLFQKENSFVNSKGIFNEKLGKFATGDTSHVYIWDIHTGELLTKIEKHSKQFNVLFNPKDNNILLHDQTLSTFKVIDAGSGKVLFSIRDTTALWAKYDSQGKYICLYGYLKNPEIIDATNGKHIAQLNGLNGESVFFPYFSDNSKYAMALVERDKLAVWDLKDLIPTSVENDDTPHTVENNLLTFTHSDNELKVLVNEPLHHTQNFTIYNVCGQKMQGGIIPSSSSEYTVHYDTLQSGVYYFECTVNGDRYVYQFAIIR